MGLLTPCTMIRSCFSSRTEYIRVVYEIMKSKSVMPILIGMFALLLIVSIIGVSLSKDSESSSKVASSQANVQSIEEKVFPKDKVVDVKITMDEDDFQDILDNASAEEMKTASVEYNGIKLDNIGIRAKGNLSLRSVVNMEDSDRYSFKLSFDEYISGQSLFGIDKINLNNNYSDSTYMREFLTYELAEEMGLPTPEYSYVNVYINDKLWGFYLAIEQVGDSYLDRNFDNTTGDLYKAEFGGGMGGGTGGGGGDLKWVDDKVSSYSSLVKKSGKSNDADLIAMLDELNNGTDYESVLDVEEALKYVALNVLTVNTDSYIGQNQQNYYLYENDGVFSVLPWDYNMAFGGLGGSSSLLIDEPTQGAVADRPLIAKLLEVEEYKELYHHILQNALDGFLSSDTFNNRVQEISKMISTYVEQDPSAFYTYEEYQNGVKSLQSSTASIVSNYKKQLNGTIASTNNGEGSGGSMGGRGGGGFGGKGQGDLGMTGVPNNTDGNAGAPTQTGTAAQGDAANGQGEQGVPGDLAGNGQGGFPEMPEGFNGQMPEGFDGQMPTFGGGDRGGFGGDGGGRTVMTNNSTTEAIMTLSALGLLVLSGAFIILYKRKRS